MEGKKHEFPLELSTIQEDTKVIAQINIASAKDALQAKIEEYTHCPLCGTEMLFTHVTHFTYLEVQEEASCPHCHITTVNETHRLQ